MPKETKLEKFTSLASIDGKKAEPSDYIGIFYSAEQEDVIKEMDTEYNPSRYKGKVFPEICFASKIKNCKCSESDGVKLVIAKVSDIPELDIHISFNEEASE